jgi:spermidine synthase
VTITISEERGVRFLHFGTPWIQGAMRIARPYALELEYTRDLMAPLALRDPEWPASVLQVGLGAGSITKFLHRQRPRAKLTVVELREEVVAAARYHFRLPEEDARLRIVIGDGADYLAAKDRRFDWIVLDGYDGQGRSGILDTEPFYASCRQRLAGGGMLSVNLLTRTRGVKPSVDRMRRAFDDRVLVLPRAKAGNTVVIASADEAFDESAEVIKLRTAQITSSARS